ncbi:MAG: LPS assembly lipoprotein LptE [Pseudohongiellaceae bacterium]
MKTETRKQSLFIRRYLLLCLLLPGACGFSLRGGDQLLAELPNLALNLQQPAAELPILLQRRLASAGVNILNDNEAAQTDIPVLTVEAEQLVSRPVTVNPRARAAQYELLMSVTISVAGVNTILMEPDVLSVERLFFENIETISGNLEEMQVIQAEMRRELVDQILRRLEALSATRANT